MSEESIVKWPFGAASKVSLDASGDQDIEVQNELTVVDGVSTQATGDRTLNLTVSEGVAEGAILFLKSKTAGTEKTVMGSGISGPDITGEAGKTFTALFVYDGSDFVQAGESVKID